MKTFNKIIIATALFFGVVGCSGNENKIIKTESIVEDGIPWIKATCKDSTIFLFAQLEDNPYEVAFYTDKCNYKGVIVIPETIPIPKNVTSSVDHYTVTRIGGYAFDRINHIVKTVTMPNTITRIGKKAFIDCDSLTTIIIPNSVKDIGEEAFMNTGLRSVTLLDGVTSIGKAAFRNTYLTTITIPNTVTSIGANPFGGCELNSITVSDGNRHYDSRNNCNAIIETATNTLISGCKNTIIPMGVTSIGKRAFINCSGLTTINIPNSVTHIGDCAFYACDDLTSVTIPNSVTKIEEFAFAECSKLATINIPESVTNIGDLAFYHCSGLTSVIIPNSIMSIGRETFTGCTSLTSITIPKSVTRIEDYAFSNCSKLTTVVIQNPNLKYDYDKVFYGCDNLQPQNVVYETKGSNMSVHEGSLSPSASSQSIPTSQPQKVYSNAYDGFVNIRQAPQSKAPILGVLRNGPEGAFLLSTEGEWKKIDCNGIVGYVYEKYVQDTPTEVFHGE